MHWKLVTAMILMALLVVFSVQNYEVVEVRFLVWHLDMSRAVLIFLVLALGIGLGWTLASLRRPARPDR